MSYISSELKIIEDQVTYLQGCGFPQPIALNLVYLSIELQKVNLQARVLAKASEDSQVQVDTVALRVIEYLREEARKESEDAGDSNTSV